MYLFHDAVNEWWAIRLLLQCLFAESLWLLAVRASLLWVDGAHLGLTTSVRLFGLCLFYVWHENVNGDTTQMVTYVANPIPGPEWHASAQRELLPNYRRGL